MCSGVWGFVCLYLVIAADGYLGVNFLDVVVSLSNLLKEGRAVFPRTASLDAPQQERKVQAPHVLTVPGAGCLSDDRRPVGRTQRLT